jgi:hypothetical protein
MRIDENAVEAVEDHENILECRRRCRGLYELRRM